MATKVTPLRTKEQRQSVRELAAAEMGVLRFITCGSVDDGKSTLPAVEKRSSAFGRRW